MGVKTYIKVDISFENITFKKTWSIEREREREKINTLMKYIQMVHTNNKEQVMQ